MAEGGKNVLGDSLSSIRDGSDADFEFTCTPCGEDNIREEAVKYCLECQEYLCISCTRHHGRLKAARTHKLVTTADGKHASKVTVTAKCRYHPDRDIEMYCGAHDMVYCAMCVATEHRSCGSVANLEELRNFGTIQTDIQHAQDEVTSIHKILITRCEEKQTKIGSLEEQKCEIQEKLQGIGRLLKEHIDKLTDKSTDNLNESFTDVNNQLESDVNLLNDTVKELDKTTSDIQKVVSSLDVTQQFVYLKLLQNSLSQAKTVQDESEKKEVQTLDFTENTGLRETITKAEDLGQVVVKNAPKQYKVKSMKKVAENTGLRRTITEVEDLGRVVVRNAAKPYKVKSMKKVTENTGLRETITKAEDLGRVVVKNAPKQYKVKAMKKVNVKMEGDSKTCFISNICMLQDGTILLTDWNNKNLKRLDDSYNVRDHCDLDAQPTAICCTGQNEVAVKMYNNKVQFSAVGTSLSKVREISIEGGRYRGMVYCYGDLLLSTGKGVSVYSKNGRLLQTIENDVNGHRIFQGKTQHMAVSDETVFVTDSSNGAVCLRKDGTVRQEFRDHRIINAEGVCVSSDSTVFMSDWSSYNIVIFSSAGKCLGELLTKEDGVMCPGPLLYDNYKNCFILACLTESEFIHILEMSH